MEVVWTPLRSFFEQRGFNLWKRGVDLILWPDVDDSEEIVKCSSGYAYATQHRGLGPAPGSVRNLFAFESMVRCFEFVASLANAPNRIHCAARLAEQTAATLWSASWRLESTAGTMSKF